MLRRPIESAAITGRTLTDPLGQQDGLQHGVGQLALSPRSRQSVRASIGRQLLIKLSKGTDGINIELNQS